MSPGKYATVLALAKANPKGGLTFEANFEQSLPHPLAFRVVLSIPKGVGPN